MLHAARAFSIRNGLSVLCALAWSLCVGSNAYSQEDLPTATIASVREIIFYVHLTRDDNIHVVEHIYGVEIEPPQGASSYHAFFRDIEARIFEVSAVLRLDANNSEDLEVEVIPRGDGSRVYVNESEPRSTDEPLSFMLSYTMQPRVIFGAEDEELTMELVRNHWEVPIETVHFQAYWDIDGTALEPFQYDFGYEVVFTLGGKRHGFDTQYLRHEDIEGDFTVGQLSLLATFRLQRPLAPDEAIAFAVRLPPGTFDSNVATSVDVGSAFRASRFPGIPKFDIGSLLIGFVVYFVISFWLFLLTAGWIVFRKADEPGWASIVPLYNIWVLVRMAERPWWWAVLFHVPLGIIQLILGVILSIDLSKRFGHGIPFGLGLAIAPFIFVPLLAFGDDEYTSLKAD